MFDPRWDFDVEFFGDSGGLLIGVIFVFAVVDWFAYTMKCFLKTNT